MAVLTLNINRTDPLVTQVTCQINGDLPQDTYSFDPVETDGSIDTYVRADLTAKGYIFT